MKARSHLRRLSWARPCPGKNGDRFGFSISGSIRGQIAAMPVSKYSVWPKPAGEAKTKIELSSQVRKRAWSASAITTALMDAGLATAIVLSLLCTNLMAQEEDSWDSLPKETVGKLPTLPIVAGAYPGAPPDSLWPSTNGVHSNSKLTAVMNGLGTVSEFRFPASEGVNYSWMTSLWIGGIVGGDTLVTTGQLVDLSLIPNRNDSTDSIIFVTSWGYEVLPPMSASEQRAVTPIAAAARTVRRVQVADTFTTEGGFRQLPYDFSGRPHRPMRLSIVLKTYSTNELPYRNLLLMDYTITNVGHSSITDGYLGIFTAPEICPDGSYGRCSEDNLFGSFRDIGTFYYMDNDGDPVAGQFVGGLSPLAAVAIRPVLMKPPPSDTNFNWWTVNEISGHPTDFGPRLIGTASDPFRDYRTGGLGSPNGDLNKYYMMSHSEWDYDQVTTAGIAASDNNWLPVDTAIIRDIADGQDMQGLLSLGPFDLMPDSSVRVVFAMFGGDLVHTDPDNGRNLWRQDYETYRRSLNFNFLRATALQTEQFCSEAVAPMLAPSGLTTILTDADSATFGWDRRVFDDIEGYQLFLSPLSDSMLIAPGFVKPQMQPDQYSIRSRLFGPAQGKGTIHNLRPGQFYFASVAHVVNGVAREKSTPVILGYDNTSLDLPAPKLSNEFVYLSTSDSVVVLEWEKPEDVLPECYRIYRTYDSAEAFGRYRPFVSYDTSGLKTSPSICMEYESEPYCYYEMNAYDSVDGASRLYVDSSSAEGAYYWIGAVARPGFESPWSGLIRTERLPPPQRDIAVVFGSTHSEHDYVYADSIEQFYDRLLDGFEFDLYHWVDTNINPVNCESDYCTDWRDLAQYRTILIEEFAMPRILGNETEQEHKLLTHLIDAGRTVAYFGSPPGNRTIALNSHTDSIEYSSESFESKYFGLVSLSLRPWLKYYNEFGTPDSLAGFNGAIPIDTAWPDIRIDYSNNRLKPFIRGLFDTDSSLPMVGAYAHDNEAKPLYRYRSAYAPTSQLSGRPCGLVLSRRESPVYLFSFHLWAVDQVDARALVEMILQRRVIEHKPERDPDPPLPNRIALHQNYPNPFNEGTTIAFELKYSLPVTLELFNILGQHIRTLASGKILSAGGNSIEWDGRNQKGNAVASGVYFYRLTAGNQTATKKMLLLK